MSVLRTVTGEPYQPCRVYYGVDDRAHLIEILEQLQCFCVLERTEHWHWIFDFEARRLRFERIYRKIDRNDRPVILGELKLQNGTELDLTVYSFDRLLQGILFLDKHIPRTVAQVKRMRLVNRFFDHSECPAPPPQAANEEQTDRQTYKQTYGRWWFHNLAF